MSKLLYQLFQPPYLYLCIQSMPTTPHPSQFDLMLHDVPRPVRVTMRSSKSQTYPRECPERFTTSSENVIRHERIHDGSYNSSHSSSLCNQIFTSVVSLQQHVFIRHNTNKQKKKSDKSTEVPPLK